MGKLFELRWTPDTVREGSGERGSGSSQGLGAGSKHDMTGSQEVGHAEIHGNRVVLGNGDG